MGNVPSPALSRTWTNPFSPATATSSFPSPFRSASAIPRGLTPAPYCVAFPSMPLPSPNSELNELLLMTATSSFPSPFRSPSARAAGMPPGSKPAGGPKVPSPWLSITYTSRPAEYTMSGLPSPFRSPAATPSGSELNSVSSVFCGKVPCPVPKRTVSVPALLPFVTTKSTCPSPLKSAVAMSNGPSPAGTLGTPGSPSTGHEATRQAPPTHVSPSPQTTGLVPTHTPDWHASVWVQASASLHGAPSRAGLFTGEPPSQTSSVQGLPSFTGMHSEPPEPPCPPEAPEPPCPPEAPAPPCAPVAPDPPELVLVPLPPVPVLSSPHPAKRVRRSAGAIKASLMASPFEAASQRAVPCREGAVGPRREQDLRPALAAGRSVGYFRAPPCPPPRSVPCSIAAP